MNLSGNASSTRRSARHPDVVLGRTGCAFGDAPGSIMPRVAYAGRVPGYNFYLMREPAIGEGEWLEFVEKHSGFRRESEQNWPQPIVVFDLSANTKAGFYWTEPGEVLVRVDLVDADDLAELVALATELGGRVEGADGETYGPDGPI